MKKLFLLLILFFIIFQGFVYNVYAQKNSPTHLYNFKTPCGTVEYQKFNEKRIPNYEQSVNKTFEKAKQLAAQLKATRSKSQEDEILKIPVVVHVLYNKPTQNLPDSVIQRQIATLNQDYRRLNPDTIDTRAEFKDLVADAGIEFYLATKDPDGNPTTGIDRKEVDVASFLGLEDAFALLGGDMSPLERPKKSSEGGVDPWNPKAYLNLWSANLAVDIFGQEAPILLGFATPPTEMVNAEDWPEGSIDPNMIDGVVIHYEVIGDNNPYITEIIDTISGKGRTATHEIGHYLGLRHIWGDGDCSMDDGIEDTPDADDAAQQVCDYTKNTCTESPIEYHDMIENYMDYAKDQCMNAFTHDQVAVMRANLLQARTGLLGGQGVGINANNLNINTLKIAITPNPATATNALITTNTPATAYIYTIQGKLLTTQTLIEGKNALSISNFAKGVYFVKVTSKTETALQKLIIK